MPTERPSTTTIWKYNGAVAIWLGIREAHVQLSLRLLPFLLAERGSGSGAAVTQLEGGVPPQSGRVRMRLCTSRTSRVSLCGSRVVVRARVAVLILYSCALAWAFALWV